MRKIFSNLKNLDNFNLKLNDKEIRFILTLIIIFVIILLFRKKFNYIFERFIVFTILFLLFLVITKNLIVTFIGSSIIFLLVNLIIGYRDTLDNIVYKSNTVENFEDLDKTNDNTISSPTLTNNKDIKEDEYDKKIFERDDFKKASGGIQDLLKQINGGIELKESDIELIGFWASKILYEKNFIKELAARALQGPLGTFNAKDEEKIKQIVPEAFK